MKTIKTSLRFDLRMYVKGWQNLKNAVEYLASSSVSFGVEPYPEDYYMIAVKHDAGRVLEIAQRAWGVKEP